VLVGQIALLPERSGGKDDLAGDLAAAEFAVGFGGVGEGIGAVDAGGDLSCGQQPYQGRDLGGKPVRVGADDGFRRVAGDPGAAQEVAQVAGAGRADGAAQEPGQAAAGRARRPRRPP